MAKSPKFQWAGKEHALLTETTAMSCWSWSLPAGVSCPGKQARSAEDICYGCYAQIGAYNYPSPLECQAARWAWLRRLMRTKAGRQLWVDTMVAAIKQCATNGYFRWHDSGDVFSPRYCRMIAEVCKRTRGVKHWLPTRSWRLPWGGCELGKLNALANVQVRPSALQFGDSPPKIAGLGKGSTAYLEDQPVPKSARECPKASKGNADKSCEQAGCRLCWQNRAGAGYLVHGRRGTQYVHHATTKEQANRLAMVELKMSYSS